MVKMVVDADGGRHVYVRSQASFRLMIDWIRQYAYSMLCMGRKRPGAETLHQNADPQRVKHSVGGLARGQTVFLNQIFDMSLNVPDGFVMALPH